jgi:hypothetical protein
MAQAVLATAATKAAIGRGRLSWRAELATMILAAWLMVGAVLDAWAHANLSILEMFFTPWHSVLYSGFVATGAWIGWQIVRAQQSGRRGLDAVPIGYGWGLIGLAVFVVGGVCDMLWHTVFGIEQGVEAALSPTHQILIIGTLLVLSSPFRAAWTADPMHHEPRYRAFLPAVLSLTFVTMNVALIVVWLTTFRTGAPATNFGTGITSILVTNVLLVAPVLLMIRRWVLPIVMVTTLFTVMTVFLSAVDTWARPWLIMAVAAAGLAIDLLLRVLRPSPERTTAFWAIGFVVPLVLWGAWFTATALAEGIDWSVELWSGTLVWTGMLGLALSLLMVPPRPLES